MKKIAVLFGGCSSEYEVSLQSAYAVIQHLDTSRYQPVLIGIDRCGCWYLFEGDRDTIPADTWREESRCYPAVLSPDRRLHGLLVWREGSKTAPVTLPLDGAFPVLHGKNGEDGTMQGALELSGIPVIGCNTLASALCMDKDAAHRMAEAAGVKVPKSRLLFENNPAAAEKAAEEVGYPLFVKPLRAGSSFGITRVEAPAQLLEAAALAFTHDSVVILEEMIQGFEVGCAVMGYQKLLVGEVDEIELSEGFFDYTEKYTLKTSRIYVPARIDEKKAQEIKETAKLIYKSLGCSCFARVDMFLTLRGDIYFNEVNTIPGFTEHSRYPGMMREAGISFGEMVNRLADLALKEAEKSL